MNSPSRPTATPIVVLLCEDEPIIMMSTSATLEDFGMTVVEATSIAEARAALDAGSISVLVTDVHLPDGSGMSKESAPGT